MLILVLAFAPLAIAPFPNPESWGSMSGVVRLSPLHKWPLTVVLNTPDDSVDIVKRVSYSPTPRPDALEAFRWIKEICREVFFQYPTLWDNMRLFEVLLVTNLHRNNEPLLALTMGAMGAPDVNDKWQRIYIDIRRNAGVVKLRHAFLHEIGHALGNSWSGFGPKWKAIAKQPDPSGQIFPYERSIDAQSMLKVMSPYARFVTTNDNRAPIVSAIGFEKWEEDSAEMIGELLTTGGLQAFRRFCAVRPLAWKKLVLIRQMMDRYGGAPIAKKIGQTVLNTKQYPTLREDGKKVLIVLLDSPTLDDLRASDSARSYYLREGASSVNVIHIAPQGVAPIYGVDSHLVLTPDTLMVVVGPIQLKNGVVLHSGRKTAEDVMAELNMLVTRKAFVPPDYPNIVAGVHTIRFLGAQDSTAKVFCSAFILAMAALPSLRRVNAPFVISEDEASLVTPEGEVVTRLPHDKPMHETQMTTGESAGGRRAPDKFTLSWDLKSTDNQGIMYSRSQPSVTCFPV